MSQHHSSWAVEVGSIASIAIRVHVTFLILLVWLVFASGSANPLREGVLISAVFGCVLAHELGHALIARRFGIQTRDITLYPFGGIASITSQPAPWAELGIAFAGPLVNVLIALALLPFVGFPVPAGAQPLPGFLEKLFAANVALALFNLLPALPMDGGRVLRALLALLHVGRPTRIAALVSRGICLMMVAAALYLRQPMLLIVAVIIAIGAEQERLRADTRTIASAFTAADVMVPRHKLESIPHGTTISQALRIALTSLQPLYLVTMGDEPLGIAFREDILEHAATQPDEYISAIAMRSLPRIEGETRLDQALATLEEGQCHVANVSQGGEFVGLLVADRIADFLIMKEIKGSPHTDDETEWPTPL